MSLRSNATLSKQEWFPNPSRVPPEPRAAGFKFPIGAGAEHAARFDGIRPGGWPAEAAWSRSEVQASSHHAGQPQAEMAMRLARK